MRSTEVAALISALQSGTMTLDEVADRFRHRNWESARRPQPSGYREQAEQLDPGLPVPDSIDEVTVAYDRGELTADQYDVLCGAIADSFRAESRPRNSGLSS